MSFISRCAVPSGTRFYWGPEAVFVGVAAALEGSAADAMTTSPTTISPDAVASEALKVMEERKITSLPVVEDGGKLVGVVHLHDLWRTELF